MKLTNQVQALAVDPTVLLYNPFKSRTLEGDFFETAMTTDYLNNKILPSLKLLPALNFNAAVIFLMLASLMSATGSTYFFDNNTDLYGPLASNLRLMLIYLTLSQFGIYCFCSYCQNFRLLIPAGLFWLVLIGAIEFYGMVNEIAIDEDYSRLFFYLGASNLAYGGFYSFNENLRSDIK